jgi:hypothetical protein
MVGFDIFRYFTREEGMRTKRVGHAGMVCSFMIDWIAGDAGVLAAHTSRT